MTLPEHKLWKDSIIRVLEKDIEQIPFILNEIDKEKEIKMMNNCKILYKHFRKNYKG